MTLLAIKPFRRFRHAEVTPPGSKSITNRALILAALRTGTTRLSGALFSEDTRTMVACLQALGFRVTADEVLKTIAIDGQGGKIPADSAELYVANAGTTARFLTAMLALKPGGSYKIDGSEAMRKRPMAGLLRALEKLGCSFEFHGESDCFPFTMRTSGVTARDIDVDASASSQILSALMQIAPVAATRNDAGIFEVFLKGETVSRPFVEMTARMIAQFGGAVEARGNTFSCGGAYGCGDFDYVIEPDATAASYFQILPFVHRSSQVRICGLDIDGLQGDAAFASELSTPPHDLLACSQIEASVTRTDCIVTAGMATRGFDIDFNAISDTFLTLAAVAPLLDAGTPLTIRGIAHTRKQETDRIAAMANELSKILGEENVSQTEDSLTLTPIDRAALRTRADAAPGGKIRIATYKDHRVAMSFGVLGTFDLRGDGTPWIEIENPECCGKTFPDFFEVLERIRA